MAENRQGGICISYRLNDARVSTARLYLRLKDHFGPDQVTMDLGDGATGLEAALRRRQVMLVVIGPGWHTGVGDPDDPTRLEIEAALRLGLTVVPILAEGARLPPRDHLPQRLDEWLAGSQVLVLQNGRFTEDVDFLTRWLERTIGVHPARRRPAAATTRPPPARQATDPIRDLKVFLCHSSSDKPKVRALSQRLRQEGARPWLDEEDLLPGQDWDLEIRKAIRACQIVLVCLSKASITKVGYVQKEIRHVLDVADEQPEGTIFLIPVKLEPCDLPDRIRRWHSVNLFEDAGYGKLLRALRSRAGEPAS